MFVFGFFNNGIYYSLFKRHVVCLELRPRTAGFTQDFVFLSTMFHEVSGPFFFPPLHLLVHKVVCNYLCAVWRTCSKTQYQRERGRLCVGKGQGKAGACGNVSVGSCVNLHSIPLSLSLPPSPCNKATHTFRHGKRGDISILSEDRVPWNKD